MQKIESYSTKEAFVRLLLQGPPGSGKTTLACAFPKPYFIDIDVNLAGPLRFRKNHQLQIPVGYDRLDIDELEQPVPLPLRWQRFDTLIVAAQKNDDIETIVIDSATGLSDVLMAETNRLQPNLKDGRQTYQFFLIYGKVFLGKLSAMRKNIVFTAHERVEKDEMTQVMQYRLAWPGQLGDYMGAFFTNVWRCEVKSEGYPPKPKFEVRTFQDAQHYGLKNDLELPSIFEFNWDVVKQKLELT